MKKTVEKLEEIMFVNFNLDAPKMILKEKEEQITNGMTESEKKAYQLGVENAFGIIKDFLNQENSDKTIQFYEKGELREFTLEEIVELVK